MRSNPMARREPSKIESVLRTIFYALLFAFLFGFVFGTLIKQRFDQPTRYIGSIRIDEPVSPGALALRPGHVRDADSRVLMPGDHEEKV